MTYQSSCSSVLFLSSKEKRDLWMQLMLQEKRNWKRIYDLFPDDLSYYISRVRVQAITSVEASIELEEICEIFDWHETDFSVLWRLGNSSAQPEVEIESFDGIVQALLYGEQPTMDMSDSWVEEGKRVQELYWREALDAELTVLDLELK